MKFCMTLGVTLALFSSVQLAEAQRTRASETVYLRVGGGASIDETDFPSYAVEPFAIIGEIGYQFTPSWSAGAGYQYGEYPRMPNNYRDWTADLEQFGTIRHTAHTVIRFTPLPARPLSHYLQGGANITMGGPELGFGLSGGVGLDFAFSKQTSLFAEVSAHTTFPDDAVDGIAGARARWDALGFLGAGLRYTFRPASTRAEVRPQGPEIAERGESVRFTAVVNDDATRPLSYTWHFGDGQSARGQTVEHRYRLEGDYEVTVRADNRWGASSGSKAVRIVEPEYPIEIVTFAADPINIQVGQLVHFRSTMRGASPIDYSLAFGDGTTSNSSSTGHSYEETGRKIGSLNLDVNEMHFYLEPGSYTATLRAKNGTSNAERTVTVNVTGQLCRECADPCAQMAELNTVFFRFDRHELTDQARQLLDENISRLSMCPQLLIRIDGYTDHAGGDTYNLRLAERRAESLLQFYRNAGIEEGRISTRGLGKAPVRCSEEEVRVGCQTNRRAETIPLHAAPNQ